MTATAKRLSEAQFVALVAIAEAGPGAYWWLPYRQRQTRLYRKDAAGVMERVASAAGSTIGVLKELDYLAARADDSTSRMYLTDEGMRAYLATTTTPRYEKLVAEKARWTRAADINRRAREAWEKVTKISRERGKTERALIDHLYSNGFDSTAEPVVMLASDLGKITRDYDLAEAEYNRIKAEEP